MSAHPRADRRKGRAYSVRWPRRCGGPDCNLPAPDVRFRAHPRPSMRRNQKKRSRPLRTTFPRGIPTRRMKGERTASGLSGWATCSQNRKFRPIYLVDGLLVRGTVSALVAKPKVGKSTLARLLCLAVATGKEFFGRTRGIEPNFLLRVLLQPSPASRRRGCLLGRNRHAAPVRSAHRMPSRQSQFEAQGWPQLSRRSLGSGDRGPIKAHCASIHNANRRMLTLQ